jgi:GTPase Era involved in 16S rRNA processing
MTRGRDVGICNEIKCISDKEQPQLHIQEWNDVTKRSSLFDISIVLREMLISRLLRELPISRTIQSSTSIRLLREL